MISSSQAQEYWREIKSMQIFNQRITQRWSVVEKSYFNLFNFSFNSKLGSVDAQTKFEKGLIFCAFWGEILELIVSPTLVSCTYIYFLEKRQKQQGLYQLKTREPRSYYYYIFLIVFYYDKYFFICSSNSLYFSIT